MQARSEAAVSNRKAAPESPLPDIDSLDENNPLAATEYVNDIYSYYRRAEPRYRVSPTYMASQVCALCGCLHSHAPTAVHGAKMCEAVRTLISCVCTLQVDINEKMRSILIDWLVEVHLKFKVC